MDQKETGPKKGVQIKWSSDFAYVIGLITSDGCLYNDKRHISFVSQDQALVESFKKILGLKVKIGLKTSSISNKRTPSIQFGDVKFFRFLEGIGLMPAKSLVLKKIKIPKKLFFDFLRGYFDGDGTTYSYWDTRWRSSFMFYTGFASGSLDFLKWIQKEINIRLGISGHITSHKNKNSFQLKYAKADSLKLIKKMYHPQAKSFLERKKLKIDKALAIFGEAV